MTKLSLAVNVRCSKQRLWDIITHPERYSSFVKNIKNISVLRREGIVSLVHWKILLEEVEFQWTEQCRNDKENSRIYFHAIKGDFTVYDGSLAIEHNQGGVALILDATLDWGMPSFEKVIAKVIEERVRRAFTGMLVAIKRHAERNQPSKTFGFVIHPLDLGLISIAFREPTITSKRKDLISKAFEWLPPFKCSDIVGLQTPEGQEVDGALIYCPLLPEQMVNGNSEIALRRTIEAVQVAESLGVKLVGLGAYAANIGRKGVLVSEAVRIPVTTGTAYTIATALNGIEVVCSKVGVTLEQLSVGIVGATGAIGSICAELLGKKVNGLFLSARNQSRLDNLVAKLQEQHPVLRVTGTTELDWLIANSDILILSTSSPALLVDAKSLRPGTIVCDISRPRNISPESVEETHGTVLAFDGGIVKPCGDVDFDFYFGLPKGLAYACMAETMILALAERYEGYSLGGRITPSQVEEISKLGKRFGFKLAELRWCEEEVSEETFDIVRSHIRQKLAKSWA